MADHAHAWVSAINAVFVPEQKLTRYSASLLQPGTKAKYQWGLQPPKNDKTCFHFFVDPGGKSVAWHHADTDAATTSASSTRAPSS